MRSRSRSLMECCSATWFGCSANHPVELLKRGTTPCRNNHEGSARPPPTATSKWSRRTPTAMDRCTSSRPDQRQWRDASGLLASGLSLCRWHASDRVRPDTRAGRGRREAKLAEIAAMPAVGSRFSLATTVAELTDWWLDSVARHRFSSTALVPFPSGFSAPEFGLRRSRHVRGRPSDGCAGLAVLRCLGWSRRCRSDRRGGRGWCGGRSISPGKGCPLARF